MFGPQTECRRATPCCSATFLRANAAARSAWDELKRAAAVARPHLEGYGQLKEPAWEAMMVGADWWATATGWTLADGEVAG